MYQVGNSVEQVFGGSVIKQGDRTPLGFNFRDENGELVSLTGATVQFKIASNKGVVVEKQATIFDEYTVKFSLGEEDITGAGDMRIEFIVTYSSGLQEKFPSNDWQRIRITPTLENVEKYGVGYITFEKLMGEFQNQFDELTDDVEPRLANAEKNASVAESNSTQAVSIANSIQEQFNQVVIEGDSSVEAAQARVDLYGTEFHTLKERADYTQIEIQQHGANVKTFGASGSDQSTTGSISASSNKLTLLDVKDFKIGHGVRVLGAYNIREVVSLKITTAATTNGNVTVYLDESNTNVSLSNGDTPTTVAAKIRGATFPGWTTGGTGDTVTFTANGYGKRLFYYNRNSTGANGSTTLTTAGEADLTTIITAISGKSLTLRDLANTSVTNAIVYHEDTEAISNAIDSIEAGKVVFPQGVYNYRYIYKLKNNISFEGYKAKLVTYSVVGDVKNNFHIQGSNIEVRDLDFDFNREFNTDTTFKPQSYAGGNNHVRLGGDRVSAANGGWQDNLLIENCKVNGGYAGGIDIYYANNAIVRNCDVTNTLGNGINFSNCQHDILVENSTVDNTRDDGIQNVCDTGWKKLTKKYIVRNCKVLNSYAKGISTTGADTVLFEGNYVDNTYGGGIQPFYDSYYQLGRSRNVVARDNTIVNAGKNYGPGKYKTSVSANADGIYISADTMEVTLENNRIYSSARYGIIVINGAKEIEIKRNRVIGSGSSGIAIGDINDTSYSSAYEVSIIDNRIKDSANYAITLGGVNEGVVSGNRVKSWGNSNFPIYIRNCAYILSDNNLINDVITDVWKADITYTAGTYITAVATDGNVHIYKCTTAGLSSSSTPTWSAISGATVSDNEVIWTESGTGTTRGLTSNLIRVEGTNISVTAGKDNRLLNNGSDYPNNSIVLGDRKLAFSSGIPTSNVWKDRDVIFDSTSLVGGKVGFWCRRGGRAAPMWSASTTYTVGQYVVPTSDNGYSFKCITAGTSGSSSPTWNTATDGTTTDGTCVWQRVETSALFKPFGAIDA